MWNAFIRYWLEEYLTICIASIIKLYGLDYTNWYEGSLSTAALMSLCAISLTPINIWVFLYRNYQLIRSEEFIRKYGSLTDGLQGYEKSAMLYHVAFTVRRIAFAILIVIVPHYNWLQT